MKEKKKKNTNGSQIQTWKLVGRRLLSFLPSPPLPSPWSAICSLIPVWSILLPSSGLLERLQRSPRNRVGQISSNERLAQ
jgi:hypothetical protein